MTNRAAFSRPVDGIVIGTSAGGVDALARVLPAFPAGLDAAVFVVLHLPRERPSMLVNIFTPRCTLPLREAQDKDAVRAGTIYFAPPDYHLLIDPGPQLALSVDEPVNFSRPSIDVLFLSAADVYAERLLGSVLTGANDDGASGLEAIKRAGGTTIVQRPDEAHSPFMVESALKRTTPDFVLSLGETAELLQTLKVNGGAAQRPRAHGK